MFDEMVTAALQGGVLRHLALLARTEDELPPILSAFYAVGADQGALMLHRCHPGREVEERAALSAAGLDVERLQVEGRLLMWDLPRRPPHEEVRLLDRLLQDARARGFAALWASRFAVRRRFAPWEAVVHHDRELEDAFREREVVTLCPYSVGDLDPARMLDRFATLAEFHDGVLVAAAGTIAFHDAELMDASRP